MTAAMGRRNSFFITDSGIARYYCRLLETRLLTQGNQRTTFGLCCNRIREYRLLQLDPHAIFRSKTAILRSPIIARMKRLRHQLPSKRPASARRKEVPLRVAVLIESSRAYGRGLLLGVAKYVHEFSHWQVYSHERELQSTLPRWLDGWKGHGVIARIEGAAMAQAIRRLRVPVVDLRRIGTGADFPALHTDEHAVVRLVLEHFLERGFQHFAFWGFEGADYSERRELLLREHLAKRKKGLHVYSPTLRARKSWTIEYEQLEPKLEQSGVRWLQSLPKPIAVMACNDIAGLQVLEVCRLAALRVPDQVAVIGVDNDEVLCQLADPPLTSVAPDTVRIGYEAAVLLDEMMAGKRPQHTDRYIEPIGIVPRRSTDTLVIPHPGAAQALSFLRRHFREPITLKDLDSELPISLRSIQDAFKKHVGRSLHQELDRLRATFAKDLLREFSVKLQTVAVQCGFSNPRHFRRTFLRETGQTPQQYRREFKVSARSN
ncbi:MAG TPA: DNA-binding transcriptional regulator [Candidatus Binatia bacterium]|nr:DNA-binding transcriptional regulator [Candidatus Binatia bacterium]